MSFRLALKLLILCAAKVHCAQESPACTRKESNPGELALNVGSEIILGCRGDVTVDSKPLITSTKHNKRLERRGDVTSHWKAQNESSGTMGMHHPETLNSAATAKNRQNTVIRRYVRRTKYEEKNKDYDEIMKRSRVTRSIKRKAQWTLNGRLVKEVGEDGGILRLPALRLTDSGNYSCYRRGKLVSSIRISAGIPPERPTLFCYKKSHISNIWCEWMPRQPITPQPQCYLLLWKGLDKIPYVNCSYSAACSCCWCVLPSMDNDRNVYTAKLCVTNTAGNATSLPYIYTPQDIIKPDPPDEVKVMSVLGEPYMLNVTWFGPATWMWELYYSLHFQLRYRALHAKEYQNVDTESRYWMILDALPYTDYEIQIRAKDEYEGQWSDWTSPVYAYTWADPETTVAPVIATSLDYFWMFPDGSGKSENKVDIRPAANHDAALWLYVLLMVGICLIITIVSLSVYFLGYFCPFFVQFLFHKTILNHRPVLDQSNCGHTHNSTGSPEI